MLARETACLLDIWLVRAGFAYDTANRRIIVSCALPRGRAGDRYRRRRRVCGDPGRWRLRRLAVGSGETWAHRAKGRRLGQPREASGARLAYGSDPIFETLGVEGGVDGGGADVGVASEFADHADINAGVGQAGAEGVAQTWGERRSSGSPAAVA